MKIMKIKIISKEEFYGEALKAAEILDREGKARHLRGECFESLEAVRNILTEKRLILWRLIRDKKPKSLLGLSQIAERDFKSVYRDVSILVSVGLVKLKKEKGKWGDTRRPMSLADSLRLEVA